LQVILAEAAVFGTAVLDFCGKSERDSAGLGVREGSRVVLGVAGDLNLEETMTRTLFLHPDFVIAQDDVRVDYLFAGRTD